jgi:hypothetical protein
MSCEYSGVAIGMKLKVAAFVAHALVQFGGADTPKSSIGHLPSAELDVQVPLGDMVLHNSPCLLELP